MAENASRTLSSLNQFYAHFNTAMPFVSPHFNSAASTFRFYLFYFIQMQFITSLDQSFAIIIPVLVTMLQLKYQGSDQKSPFATHPKTMLLASLSFFIYCLAYVLRLQFSLPRRFAALTHYCMLCCGYASLASLFSVLFPDSVCPFLYTFFALLPASKLLLQLYHKLVSEEAGDFQVHRRRIRRLWTDTSRLVGNPSGEVPQILPV